MMSPLSPPRLRLSWSHSPNSVDAFPGVDSLCNGNIDHERLSSKLLAESPGGMLLISFCVPLLSDLFATPSSCHLTSPLPTLLIPQVALG